MGDMTKTLEESSNGKSTYSTEELEMKRQIVSMKRQIEAKEAEEQRMQLEEDHREMELQRMKERCNLGKRFESRTFDTFKATDFAEQYNTCRRFADKFPDTDGYGLYIFGNAGTGKTHLGASIANYIINEKRIPVAFIDHIRLLNKIREGYNTGEDATKWYMEAPLLILDDLGKSKVTDWALEKLFEIVNYRYEDLLPTVFTSNYSLSEVAQMVGDPIASRISEMCVVMQMSGKDKRRHDKR